jgi:hypothetical protein
VSADLGQGPVVMDGDDLPPRQIRWYHGLLTLIVLAIAAMWVYVLFLAPTENRNRIADRNWAAESERICAPARAAINLLPPAATATSPQERAVVLDQANAIVDRMVRDLDGRPVTGPAREQQLVKLWLGDYATYAANRRAYSEQLKAGQDTQFAVAENGGAPITLKMDNFAEVNSMLSCQVPLDV